jgi:hypothetical protein
VLGEEVVDRRGACERRRDGGPREKGRHPSGRRRRSTGRRGGALADDGGALVEVGRALLEDGGVVEGRRRSGTTASLSGKIWQPDGVVSFSRQTKKIFKTASRVYIDEITTGGPHKATASGRPPLAGHIIQPPAVNLTTGG